MSADQQARDFGQQNPECAWFADADGDGFTAPDARPRYQCASPGAGWANRSAQPDCDDTDSQEFPGQVWHADVDGDGFGRATVSSECARADSTDVLDDTDCDDNDSDEKPGAVWWPDRDGDLVGDPAGRADCERGDSENGWISVEPERAAKDCDDGEPARFEGNIEECDGLDNDCNERVDDGLTFKTWYPDQDQDGHGLAAGAQDTCDGAPGSDWTDNADDADDCDDTEATRHPGHAELCDGLDNDCDGNLSDGSNGPDEVDSDGDRAVACVFANGTGWGAILVDGDCDETSPDAAIRTPGAVEVCDGIDNNCDTVVDNDVLFQNWYPDLDGDAHGDENAVATSTCDGAPAPSGWVLNNDDCDDGRSNVLPGATELCDGLDNDCSGAVSEGEADGDGDGWVVCVEDDINGWFDPGNEPGFGDCDDTDAARFPGNTEVCDGLDNDCDNSVPLDEIDNDSDGFVECATVAAGSGLQNGDCDDDNVLALPGGTEVCDGADNDCVGGPDDSLSFADWWPDVDGDGQGSDAVSGASLCEDPGVGWVTNNTDCDDAAADVGAGLLELCDGIDNDCDGFLADGQGLQPDGVTPQPDEIDSDGDLAVACVFSSGPWSGVQDDDDCDDLRNWVFPGAAELCDGIDTDCDGALGDGDGVPDERNTDGDAAVKCTFIAFNSDNWYGDENVTVDNDCDDGDADRFPGHAEVCDGKDNACAGPVPDNEVDNDGDGYVEMTCGTPVAGSGLQAFDCNDGDSDVHLFAAEVCDGKDNDCDMDVDEDSVFVEWWPDYDGDGFGDDSDVGLSTCDGAPYGNAVDNNGDCDESDALVYAGAPELCDGIDNDCDGLPASVEQDADADGAVPCTFDRTWQGTVSVTADRDCDDLDASVKLGAPELCDGQDNDCDTVTPTDEIDGDADGAVPCTWDANGWDGDVAVIADRDCDDTDGSVNRATNEVCDGRDNDCDGAVPGDEQDDDGDGAVECTLDAGGWDGDVGVTAWQDCNDNDASVFVGATEICDGQDNDCDGAVPLVEIDNDIDGVVECTFDVGGWDGPAFYAEGDCDDGDAEVYPGAFEDCDGKLNNCATGVLPDIEKDLDGDLHVPCIYFGSDFAANWEGTAGIVGDKDCDDTEAAVYTGNTEICDGLNNDCAAGIDDGPDITIENWFPDDDGDGYGNSFVVPTSGCAAPDTNSASTNPPNVTAWVSQAGDCDDGDADIHVDATEHCDGVDWDCDGGGWDSDAVDAIVYYADRDGDGHGEPGSPSPSCSEIPPSGFVQADLADDCDDTDTDADLDGQPDGATRHPALGEICDGIDNDCDLVIDDNPLDGPWWYDGDGDTWGDRTDRSCVQDPGYVSGDHDGDLVLDDSDCRDDLFAVNPGVLEVAGNQIDDDCDGLVDGGLAAVGLTIDGNARMALDLGYLNGRAKPSWMLPAGSSSSVIYLLEPPYVAGDPSTSAVGSVTAEGVPDVHDVGPSVTGSTEPTYLVGAKRVAGDSGRIYLIDLPIVGSVDAATSAAAVITGNGNNSDLYWLGWGAALPGSVDGDGNDDVVACGYSDHDFDGDSTANFRSGGCAVFSGPLSGNYAASEAETILYAKLAYEGTSGTRSSRAGDLNGDGFDDLLTGVANARHDLFGGGNNDGPGQVYVHHAPIPTGSSYLDEADVVYEDDDWQAAAGYDLRGGFDLDADGYGDLHIAGQGSTHWVAGNNDSPSITPYQLDSVAFVEWQQPGGYSGIYNDFGDVDGDGWLDYLSGWQAANDAGAESGRAYLFFGPLPTSGVLDPDLEADRIWVGAAAGDMVNAGVLLTDADGGGSMEVVLGSSQNLDEAYLFFGEGL